MDPFNSSIQTASVNDVYEYNEIHLSSYQRDAGTNDHPEWNIRPDLHSVLGVKILSAEIPFTFYTVVDSGPGKNNTLRATRTDGTVFDLALAPGVYDVTQLANAIGSSGNFAVDWIPYRGKYSFSFLSGIAGHPNCVLNLKDNLLADLIGFPRTDFLLDSTNAEARVSPNVVNVSGPNAVYLISGAIGGRISSSIRCNGSSTPNPPVVAKIPINCNFGQVVSYTDPNPAPSFDMSMGNITHLDFALIHADNLTPLQLNGVPWSVTLQVLTQRDTAMARARDDGSGSRKRLRT